MDGHDAVGDGASDMSSHNIPKSENNDSNKLSAAPKGFSERLSIFDDGSMVRIFDDSEKSELKPGEKTNLSSDDTAIPAQNSALASSTIQSTQAEDAEDAASSNLAALQDAPAIEQAKSVSPEQAKSISLEQAKSVSPEQAKSVSPEGAKYVLPSKMQSSPLSPPRSPDLFQESFRGVTTAELEARLSVACSGSPTRQAVLKSSRERIERELQRRAERPEEELLREAEKVEAELARITSASNTPLERLMTQESLRTEAQSLRRQLARIHAKSLPANESAVAYSNTAAAQTKQK
jgi:hypothetical protein